MEYVGSNPIYSICGNSDDRYIGGTISRERLLQNAISYRECPPSKRTSVKVPSLRRLGKDKRKG